MTDTAQDLADEQDAVYLGREVADLLRRVKALEATQQLGTSSVGEVDDPDALTIGDIADAAVDASAGVEALNDQISAAEDAVRQNAEDVRIAAEAAEAAGEAGTAAGILAGEAADDALEAAQEAKDAAADALEAAENAGGGNAYEDRAPTADDQDDPDTGKPFHDAALWFVRATSTGIVTGAYQFTQPDPTVAGTWAQITLSNDVIGNLDAGKINAGYLSAERIAAGTITGALIAADTLTSREIAADAITAAELAANSVLARNVKAGEIQATHIAALAIDASKIQAGAIIAEKIGAGEVTATKIAAGAVTATSLAATAIDGKTITGATIRTAATGKRAVLGGSVISFYDSTGSPSGSIEGVTNGTEGGLVSLSAGGNAGDYSVLVGKNYLPVSGAVPLYAYAGWIENLYVDNIIDAGSNQPLGTTSFAQWTGTTSVTTGGSPNTFSSSTAPSVKYGTTIATGGYGSTLPAGVYLVTVLARMSTANSARAFLNMSVGTVTGPSFGRSGYGTGEDYNTAVGMFVSDGTSAGGRVIASGYQSNGATVTFTWTLSIARLF